jgi:hypothetical protein
MSVDVSRGVRRVASLSAAGSGWSETVPASRPAVGGGRNHGSDWSGENLGPLGLGDHPSGRARAIPGPYAGAQRRPTLTTPGAHLVSVQLRDNVHAQPRTTAYACALSRR